MNLPNLQQIMACFYKKKKGHFCLPLHRLHKSNAWLSGTTGISPCKKRIVNIQSLPCKTSLEDKRYSRNCELNWEIHLGLQLVLSCYQGCRPIRLYGYWRSKIWAFGKVPLFQVLHNFFIRSLSISFLFKQKLKDTGLHVNKQLDSYILFKIKAIFRTTVSHCPWQLRETRKWVIAWHLLIHVLCGTKKWNHLSFDQETVHNVNYVSWISSLE